MPLWKQSGHVAVRNMWRSSSMSDARLSDEEVAVGLKFWPLVKTTRSVISWVVGRKFCGHILWQLIPARAWRFLFRKNASRINPRKIGCVWRSEDWQRFAGHVQCLCTSALSAAGQSILEWGSGWSKLVALVGLRLLNCIEPFNISSVVKFSHITPPHHDTTSDIKGMFSTKSPNRNLKNHLPNLALFIYVYACLMILILTCVFSFFSQVVLGKSAEKFFVSSRGQVDDRGQAARLVQHMM